jgi:ribosomal protein S12 methylthiotransferase
MEERRNRIMEIQQEVSFQNANAQVGKQLDVIIDGPVPEQPAAWIGRTYADAPDVDALAIVSGSSEPLRSGDIVKCEIVANQEYDLIAVPVEAPSRRDIPSTAQLPLLPSQ